MWDMLLTRPFAAAAQPHITPRALRLINSFPLDRVPTAPVFFSHHLTPCPPPARATLSAAPLNTMSTGKIIIYRSEGAVGEGHNIPAKPNNGAYTIGREARGGVSLVIAEPHISANQAAIFPPTPEEPTWRRAAITCRPAREPARQRQPRQRW